MRKFFYFIGISCLNFCLYLYSKIVYAQDRFMTAYGAQTFYGVSSSAFDLGKVRFLITLIGIFSALILSLISLKQRFKKFDYKSEYKKFKTKDKVKITFVDETGKVVTKRCHITSIDSKKIVFENKTDVYECTPTEIKNIRKRSKKMLALIVFCIIFLVVSVVNFIYSYYKYSYRTASAYGVIPYQEERWVEKYGVGPNWDK